MNSLYPGNGEELSNYVFAYPMKIQKSLHQVSWEGREGYGKERDFEIHYDFENFLSEQNNYQCVLYSGKKREEEKRVNYLPPIYLYKMLFIRNIIHCIR